MSDNEKASDYGKVKDLRSAMEAAKSAYALLSIFDFDFVIEQAERAHAVGPIVDPTKYHEALGDKRLDHQIEIAGACRKLVRTFDRIRKEVEST